MWTDKAQLHKYKNLLDKVIPTGVIVITNRDSNRRGIVGSNGLYSNKRNLNNDHSKDLSGNEDKGNKDLGGKGDKGNKD